MARNILDRPPGLQSTDFIHLLHLDQGLHLLLSLQLWISLSHSPPREQNIDENSAYQGIQMAQAAGRQPRLHYI